MITDKIHIPHVISNNALANRCFCGVMAKHEIHEVVPFGSRHPFKAYLCCKHFSQIMGPLAKITCEGENGSS
jgi:hypothetical protein